ncbi:exopolysaccharide Pel transporter PelG [Persephonella sp.]
MAGIGFELRKILKNDDIFSLIKAYGYSAVVSSGPWIISIISIIISGYISYPYVKNKHDLMAFMVSITYLMALSLIFTGFFQFYISRYIADRLFEKRFDKVLPNILGILIIVLILAFIVMIPVLFMLKDQGYLYGITFMFAFVVLSGVWILNIILTALKNYKFIVFSFLVAYIFTITSVLVLSILGSELEGLLISFLGGQIILFFMLLGLIIYNFESDKLVEFDFLDKKKIYTSLIFTGFFYNLGIWTDKFIFWFHPDTGEKVVSFLRNSILYDLPIFLAYLAIVPGMAVFLLRLETEFAEKYDNYYNAVRNGATFEAIKKKHIEIIETARTALFEVFRIQSIVILLLFLFSEPIFKLLKFPVFYISLFRIDLVGTGLQLFFMSILAIAFYLDKRKAVLFLTFLFFILNFVFTLISIELGIMFYGYGFALSLLVSSVTALFLLRKDFERLNYETFMLQ